VDAPRPIHKTSPISLEEFQPGYLKPLSYSQEEISNVIIKHISRKAEDLTDRQREGIARFKYQGSWNLANPENIHDLRKFFDIFNDVFFNGVLTGYCQIEVVESDWAAFRYSRELRGICTPVHPGKELDTRFRIDKPLSIISITKWCNSEPATQRILLHLETLVHEMLHAVFLLFTCDCGYGCRKIYPDMGHHIYWQAAARAIEKADVVRGNLLGLNLDWCRDFIMASDVEKGIPLPNDVVLRSLGLSIDKIWDKMKVIRQRRANPWYNRGLAKRKKMLLHESPGLRANRCIRSKWIID
jgi:hypothetical protein